MRTKDFIRYAKEAPAFTGWPLLLFFALAVMAGCASSRRFTGTDIRREQSDSVRLVLVTEYVPDTVYLTIPAQTARRESRDSVSLLENDYAVSEARIRPDGSLCHDLRTKPQRRPVEIQKPVERRDSIVYRTRVETVTEVKEVERKTKWHDKVFAWTGRLCCIAAMAYAIFLYLKRKR